MSVPVCVYLSVYFFVSVEAITFEPLNGVFTLPNADTDTDTDKIWVV